MRDFLASPILRSRYLAAVLAGLLLAAAFPKIGIAGLAWVAPALMLVAALGATGWERFRVGYVAGLAFYLATLYWLLLIPYRWHSIPLGPAAGWFSLSAYLAFYPATWVGLLNPNRLLQRSWLQRTVWTISGAALWVALEMVVARLFTGFPWNLLGASQYQLVPLIQIASVTGIYGVSFIIIWVSLSLLSAGLMIVMRPTTRSVWAGEIMLPALVLTVLFSSGFRQAARDSIPSRIVTVALAQPSIPQTLIWDPSRDLDRFRDLLHLSEQALTNHPDLLIWPEAAVPSFARWNTNIYPAITNLVRQHHVWLILGSDDLARTLRPASADEFEYYNASFLVSPDGEFVSRYLKRNLVIFGEYVPAWLPFAKWLTPIEGGFTPGNRPVTFELTRPDVKVSPLICFEDTFSGTARAAAADDIDFLVNLTNNGWFGDSAAQWQHAASALFRAVENGLPLVRCANNGLTGWVDAHGRLREVFRDARGTIYGSGFLIVQIPLPPAAQMRVPTFYHQHGDWFGWTCVGLTAISLLARKVSRGIC